MSEFKIENISIAGAPTIEFQFAGSCCAAECAGAKLAAIALDENEATIRIEDAGGELLADITVRKMPHDENITVSVMNVGAALLWSHARWVAAQADEVRP
jgi:hypothetical protein